MCGDLMGLCMTGMACFVSRNLACLLLIFCVVVSRISSSINLNVASSLFNTDIPKTPNNPFSSFNMMDLSYVLLAELRRHLSLPIRRTFVNPEHNLSSLTPI